ncbi:MAG: cupin domain-containing protein [Propionibacteriaceae bacterium]
MAELLNGVSGDVSGHPASASALSRLTGAAVAGFAADVWGRRPLLSTADQLPQDFTDLLSDDAVDELVSSRGLRTPFLRVAKGGTTLAERAFTASGGVGAGVADQVSDDKLVELFADGSTMVLQGLHRTWPPILAFCQQLAAELGHPVQANAYVTPPQNQGFSDHYDVHDVFVLQVEGEKRWSVHAPVLAAPLRDQPWTDRRAAVQEAARAEPVLEAVLRPGDCLYLPRGYLHAAQALGGVSTHLTLGVHGWTRYALAEELTRAVLAELAADEELRRSLPVGVAFDRPAELRVELDLVRERVRRAVSTITDPAVTDPLRARARQSQRAAPVGPLRQLRTATGLSDDTVIALRPHLEPALELRPDGRFILRSRGTDLVVDFDDLADGGRAGFDALLGGHALAAGLVGIDLVRRLVRAGLVVAVDPSGAAGSTDGSAPT